jgi:predicted ArsR family transcriptional regulator
MGARAGKPAKPDIRQQILRFVKLRGRAQVREVAKHMRITHEGARKTLVQMEQNGWVARQPDTEAGGLGRPKDFYSVTAAGDRLFPKAYDKLSLAILGALQEEAGKGAAKILAALAKAQAEIWAPRLEGMSVREKVEALRELYLEADPFASVEAKDGDLILIERNCPFLNVAMEHPALCSLSVSTLEMLLGVSVVREERFQAGHGRCAFRIRLGSPLPKKEFRLETGLPPAA